MKCSAECLCYAADVAVWFVSLPSHAVRKKQSTSRLRRRRATLRRRRQRETGRTQDVLNLAKSSQMYSALLNNYTLPVNTTPPQRGDGSSTMRHYEASIVYGKTELVLTNLRHFQEYSIEVCLAVYNDGDHNNNDDDNNYNRKGDCIFIPSHFCFVAAMQ